MTIIDFKQLLEKENPPTHLTPALKSLWYDAKGNWTKAHDIADGGVFTDANWIHAYLHRKEGDHWNANYWYRRAGKNMPTLTLEEEWENLVAYFLTNHS